MLEKTSKTLLLLGTCSLVYWPKVFNSGRLSLVRFETIFFVAMLCGTLHFFSSLPKKYTLNTKNKNVCGLHLILFMFLLSILISTLIALMRYNLWFNTKGVVSLIKLIMGISLFLITYEYLKDNPHFYKKLAFAFFVPPTLFVVFLLFPQAANKLNMLESGIRFHGLTNNPGLIAQLCMIAFSFLTSFLIFNVYRKKILRTVLCLLLCTGLLGLISWALMKTYFISCCFVLSVIVFLANKYLQKNAKYLFVTTGFIVLTIIVLLYFFPADMMENFIDRFKILLLQPEKEPRFAAWEYYLGLIPSNPLGLGLNYEKQFFAEWVFWDRAEVWHLGPHSFLDIWAIGGIFAGLSILCLIHKVIINVRRRLKSLDETMVPYYIGSVGAFSGLFVGSLFAGSPLTFMGFWLLLAMCLV